jgi:hypothetical protein
MTFWTEEMIREALDGTFTRVMYDGRIDTEIVEDNFQPYPNKGGRPAGVKNLKPQRYWKSDEDGLLLRMRMRNKPFAEIAWVIDRTEDSCKKRYKVLRVNGKVMV